jgi:hypothetical protein
MNLRVSLNKSEIEDILLYNFSLNRDFRFFYYFKETPKLTDVVSLKDNKIKFERMRKKIRYDKEYTMVTNLEFNRGVFLKPVYFQFALLSSSKFITDIIFVKYPKVNINQIIKTAKVLPVDEYTFDFPTFRHFFFRNIKNVEQLTKLIEWEDFLDFFKKIKIIKFINPNMAEGDHILYKKLKEQKKENKIPVWAAQMTPVKEKGFKTEIQQFLQDQSDEKMNFMIPIKQKYLDVIKSEKNSLVFNFDLFSEYYKKYTMKYYNIKYDLFKKDHCKGKIKIQFNENEAVVYYLKNKAKIEYQGEVFKNLQFLVPNMQIKTYLYGKHYYIELLESWDVLYHSLALILNDFVTNPPLLYEIEKHSKELKNKKPVVVNDI